MNSTWKDNAAIEGVPYLVYLPDNRVTLHVSDEATNDWAVALIQQQDCVWIVRRVRNATGVFEEKDSGLSAATAERITPEEASRFFCEGLVYG